MNGFFRKICKICTSTLIVFMFFFNIILFTENGNVIVYAADTNTNVTGEYYEFEEKSNYEFSSIDSLTDAVTGENTFGVFSIAGNFEETGEKNGNHAYSVKDGNIDISYTFNQSFLNAEETEWHLIEDKSDKVDDIMLDEDIMQGALIIQSSLDGETWIDDKIQTDIFNEDTGFDEMFYTTKDIQQQNGCYFRVIFVYEMEMKTGSHKVALITVEDTSIKKVAEVYKFYVENNDVSSYISASDIPRKELGEKVKTEKDNGYSEKSSLDKDDPHYGWDLGAFSVNGYTGETKDDDGTPVFLKKVGDKVTLWFNLEQDINYLNGNSDLTIAEDKNGYDKMFEVPQTNFGHGTLIIRYTNKEGVVQETVSKVLFF
jgi:hypothetical protein